MPLCRATDNTCCDNTRCAETPVVSPSPHYARVLWTALSDCSLFLGTPLQATHDRTLSCCKVVESGLIVCENTLANTAQVTERLQVHCYHALYFAVGNVDTFAPQDASMLRCCKVHNGTTICSTTGKVIGAPLEVQGELHICLAQFHPLTLRHAYVNISLVCVDILRRLNSVSV